MIAEKEAEEFVSNASQSRPSECVQQSIRFAQDRSNFASHSGLIEIHSKER